MTENETLYTNIKKLIISSPYMVKNLPVANLNTKCVVCGKMHDYKLSPVLKDSEWERLTPVHLHKEIICTDCMERSNNGQFKITQLKECLKSVNYIFCNCISLDNSHEEYGALMCFQNWIQYIIDKHS